MSSLPLSPFFVKGLGLPDRSLKFVCSTGILTPKALPVHLRQSEQWQYAAVSISPDISKRIAPHKHLPVVEMPAASLSISATSFHLMVLEASPYFTAPCYLASWPRRHAPTFDEHLGSRRIISLLTEQYLMRRYAEELNKARRDLMG